jgi:hypothetical protein
MIRKLSLAILLVGSLVFFTSSQMSNNGKAGRTNSPGETTCVNGCHNSYSLNSGPGSIIIQSPGMTGFVYTPGQTYNMSVTVAQNGVNLFGVGIEALTTTNANAGTLTITDAASTSIKTTTVSGVSRRNIVHTLNGGASASSKVFNFSWTAPVAGTGNVTFYFSGVAANGNNSESLDYVYNSSQLFTEYTCATPSQPGTINGNASLCQGTSFTYSVAAVSGATSYTWNIPSGWTGTSSTESIDVIASGNSGDITVTASNSCGTSPAQTLTVTVNPLPVPVISMNSSVTTDTLISTSAYTYQWYLNGSILNGENNSVYVPQQNANYTVEVTDLNGCTGTSADFAYLTLGINDNVSLHTLELFPNPATNFISIHTNGSLLNNEIKILDITGNIVFKSVLTNTENKIDVSKFSEGVYFAVSGTAGEKFISRFYVTK